MVIATSSGPGVWWGRQHLMDSLKTQLPRTTTQMRGFRPRQTQCAPGLITVELCTSWGAHMLCTVMRRGGSPGRAHAQRWNLLSPPLLPLSPLNDSVLHGGAQQQGLKRPARLFTRWYYATLNHPNG